MFIYRIFVTLVLLVMISACSGVGMGGNKKPEVVEDLSAEALYSRGKQLLSKGRYLKAIDDFEEIERLYPFSQLSSNGQVMVAYALYKNEEYQASIEVINQFVKLNPAHSDIAYMYYLKAICYYERIADIKRDQGITQKALAALKEVRRRFPDTYYARDARFKEDLVYDHLAGKEIEIGRFYLKNRKYIAAINRFKVVIDDYQQTSQIQEALYRSVEGYLSLGMMEEAKKHAALLGHNYPDSKWYRYAYALVEKGENSPGAVKGDSWFSGLLGEEKSTDLPKDDNADSWIRNIFDF